MYTDTKQKGYGWYIHVSEHASAISPTREASAR